MLFGKVFISNSVRFGGICTSPRPPPLIGVVTLDFFPKLLREIAWVGFALVFDHFHVCGYTAIDKLPKGKKKLEHGLAGNVVIFDQFLILHF